MSELNEIPGYEGYFVDREGNCYSSWVNKGKFGLFNEGEPKKLKGSKTSAGYIIITLGQRDKNQVRKYLHHIILEMFVSPRPVGMIACHKDDNPQNNRVENLYWGTPKQNMEDRRKNSHLNEGEKHGMSKLSEKDVLYIRSRGGTIGRTALAREMNVCYNTIYLIQTNKIWNHLEEVKS